MNTATTHQGLKVMLLEDHLFSRKQTANWIEGAGYQVSISTGNEETAFVAFQENPTDIAILDINIHGKKRAGIQLAKKLQKINKELPIIFISAYQDNFFDALSINPATYITKPYTANGLLNHIHLHTYKSYGSPEIPKYPNVHFHPKWLKVRLRVGHPFIDIYHENLLFLKSQGNDTEIFIQDDNGQNKKFYISGVNLKTFEEHLPIQQFLRIHRSFIIAKSAIEHATRTQAIISATKFSIGRSYRAEYRSWLGL